MKILGQSQLLVAQKVQRVAEENSIPVDKILALGVAQYGGPRSAGEHLTEEGIWIPGESRQCSRVVHASNVQLHDGREQSRAGTAEDRRAHHR